MLDHSASRPATALSPRLVRAANLCGLLLAALLLFTFATSLGEGADDSTQYRQAALNLLRSGDPYATTPSTDWDLAPPNPNPPLLAYLLLPAATLPQPTFRLVWFVLNSAALATLLALCLRAVGAPQLTRLWGLLAAGVLCWPAAYLCLSMGQLGIILALLAVLSFVLAAARPAAAGAALATGAAIKLYPGLLGLYYLLRGPRRPLWWAAVWGAVLLAVPLVISGLPPYENYLRKVLLGDFYPYAAEFNISLNGLWNRLFTANAYFKPIADLPALASALTLVSAVAVLVLCLQTAGARDQLGNLIAFAAWLCAMQLLTPLNGYYNLPALIFPFLVLCRCLGRYPALLPTLTLAFATALLFFPPGWNRGLPWLDQALAQGPGLLFLAPSLYGALLYLLLLRYFAARHQKVSSE